MGLEARLKRHLDAGEQLKDDLIARLKMIVDNPLIKRIDKRCFVVNDLDKGILCPHHYDNPWQVAQIVSVIEKQAPEAALKTLHRVIRTKKLRITSGKRKYQDFTVKIGDQVIRHIEGILC